MAEYGTALYGTAIYGQFIDPPGLIVIEATTSATEQFIYVDLNGFVVAAVVSGGTNIFIMVDPAGLILFEGVVQSPFVAIGEEHTADDPIEVISGGESTLIWEDFGSLVLALVISGGIDLRFGQRGVSTYPRSALVVVHPYRDSVLHVEQPYQRSALVLEAPMRESVLAARV